MNHNSHDADPWGVEDEDEYAVALSVTRAEDDDDEKRKRRRRGGPMALRGAGTRGGKRRGGAGSPAGMAPGTAGGPGATGAPGATVGGVGPGGGMPGSAGAGAMGPGASGGLMPQPMSLGIAGGGSSGMGSMMAGTRGFTPGAAAAGGPGSAGGMVVGSVPPGGGLMAAGADGVNADQLRDAIRRSGLEGSVYVDADGRIIADPWVDTNGDGIPDTPSSKVGQQPPGGGTTPGVTPGVPRIPGDPGGTLPGQPAPGQPVPGMPGPGLPSPGVPLPGVQPPPNFSTPYQPAPAPAPAPAPTPGLVTPGPIAAGDGTRSGGDSGGGGLSYPGGSTNTGGTSTGGSQSTGSGGGNFGGGGYVPSGTDFSVATGELRQAANTWDGVSDKAKPMKNAMMTTPDPEAMFGVLTRVVPAYTSAVDTSIDTAEASGNEAAGQAIKLATAANNYDDVENENTGTAGSF